MRLKLVSPLTKCGQFNYCLAMRRNFHLTCYRNSIIELSHTVYNPPSGGTNDPPLLITHGLLGSKSNWNSIAKAVTRDTKRQVIVFDARNHGDSPHASDQSVDRMAEDVIHLAKNALSIDKFSFMGHSMGGRTAMVLALRYPTIVEKVVVVDVSPVSLQSGFHSEMMEYVRTMLNINFNGITKLSEARKFGDAALTAVVPQAYIRAFLLTNLAESEDGKIIWKPNLPILLKAVESIGQFPEDLLNKTFESPTLFIRGQKSSYVPDVDIPEIKKLFPTARVDTIQGSGHWPHADNVKDFLGSLLPFLKS